MYSCRIKIAVFLLIGFLLLNLQSYAQKIPIDSEIEVSLRMVGHQVLLNSKDSSSRVLPIVMENGRYKIQFESEFKFIPEDLVATIDTALKQTNLITNYIVEVEQCETEAVVYSFKMDDLNQSDIVPCQSRIQPKACYNLLITILEDDANETVVNTAEDRLIVADSWTRIKKYLSVTALILMFSMVSLFFWKRNQNISKDPNLIPLGEYRFDKRNTELLIEEQRIELSGKEADLLLLLYDSANTTVERDVILNMVWGDEGDYVGRTLDVFISKLRKKLEFDAKVKIVNIRGVGYKLVMDA